MPDRILQQPPRLSRLLTTNDAAKLLGLSTRGVRKLARRGDLMFEATRSGQLIFHIGDVQRCCLQRADERTRSRPATLAAIRLRMVKAGVEPVQLSFLHGLGLRIVARGERSGPDRESKVARSFEKRAGSDRPSFVNRKAAGARR